MITNDGRTVGGVGGDPGAVGAWNASEAPGRGREGGDAGSTWGPVATLGIIVLITASWWALALWPSGVATPGWFERARAVCFNLTESGLPDASGWLLLVGQPLGMVGLLAVGWSEGLERGMRRLAGSVAGRTGLAIVALLVLSGLGAAGVRVSSARAAVAAPVLPGGDGVAVHSILEREPPSALLVDQSGARVGVPTFEGRPLLVTFAFGNCATICPVVVHQATMAVERLRTAGVDAALLVVTLDPWRDTPARLRHMADTWELPEGGHVVSGTVAEVEPVLDEWRVARQRNDRTGDVVHPALTYVLDRQGTIRYATTGRADDLVELVGGLER